MRMSLSECGAKAVEIILAELNSGVRLLPAEFRLSELASKVGTTPQNVGSAYTPYIDRPLLAKGYTAVKNGKPVRITIRRSPH